MKIATGDAVVCLDGDLQDEPEVIADFHKKWIEGYDVGLRPSGETRRRPYQASRVQSILPRAPRGLVCEHSRRCRRLRLLDRKVVDALNALPENNRFMRGLRSWVGFRQIGVPHVRPDRMFGQSTLSFRRYFGFARKGILSFSYVPLDIIMCSRWAS